jgi:hypothetical protein
MVETLRYHLRMLTTHNRQSRELCILDDIGVVTSKDDHFVLCNDSESGIILFGCEANLKFLCTVSEEIFADGTYKCCPKYFKQLYTIHGFKNGHYIPLVFCLLPSKSESCYRKMFSLLDDSCKRFNLDLCIKTIHLDFEALKLVLTSYPLLSFYKLFSKSVVLVLRICLMYMVQFTT